MASPKAREAAAVRRLIEELGAEVMVRMEHPFERSARERLSHRLSVEEVIEGCAACGLREGCQRPLVPVWSPPASERRGRVAVVGEAPSWEEERAGELGKGRAASVLFTTLRQAGLDANLVTYLNTVACWPTAGPRATRPPTRKEATACTSNVLAAVDAADVGYVILLGAHALRAWRTDLTLEQVAGGLYIWRNRWFVLPIQHTNAVLRQGADLDAKLWRQHLYRAVQMIRDDVGLEGLSTSCVGCGATMYGWDEDGVPWCPEHYDAGRGGRTRRPRASGGDPRQGRLA